MVKFGKYLEAHRVSEWNTQYVHYKQLKKYLKRIRQYYIDSYDGYNIPDNNNNNDISGDTSNGTHIVELPHKHGTDNDAVNIVGNPLRMNANDIEQQNNNCDHGSKESAGVCTIASIDFTQYIHNERARGIDDEYKFLTVLSNDCHSINIFFKLQEEFFRDKYNILYQQAQHIQSYNQQPPNKRMTYERNELNKAIRELYRGLQLLKNYKILNYTAIVKIMKKHDKLCIDLPMNDTVQQQTQSMYFIQSTVMDQLILSTENLYVQYYHNGDRKRGMHELRVTDKPPSLLASFNFGLMVGICIMLLCTLFILIGYISVNNISLHSELDNSLPVWRFLGVTIEAVWLWGMVVYIYNYYHINYEFILELDPRYQISYVQILLSAAFMSVLYILSLNIYVYLLTFQSIGEYTSSFNPNYIHLILFLSSICTLLFPAKYGFYQTRRILMLTIFNVVRAPFGPCQFKEMFVGDQLTSLVIPIVDLAFSICYYTTGDFLHGSTQRCTQAINVEAVFVIAVLPYLWRLLQCIRRTYETSNQRNTANALKYASSILNTVFSYLSSYYSGNVPALRAIWILFAVIATTYTGYWDLKYDWGLIEHISANGNGQRITGYGQILNTKPAIDIPTQHNNVNNHNNTTTHQHHLYPWYRFDKHYRFVRSHIIFPTTTPYYIAAVIDLFLRATWIFTISPAFYSGWISSVHLKTVVACLEVARRAQWNIYRLENEHTGNIEGYRAVNIVPLKLNIINDMDNDTRPSVHTSPALQRHISQHSPLNQQDELNDIDDEDSDVDSDHELDIPKSRRYSHTDGVVEKVHSHQPLSLSPQRSIDNAVTELFHSTSSPTNIQRTRTNVYSFDHVLDINKNNDTATNSCMEHTTTRI